MRHLGYHAAVNVDRRLLEALERLSEGYSPEEVEAMAREEGHEVNWRRGKRRLFCQLGAVTELHALRRAIERGLIRVAD